jgi:6,7-dimethyl-8-ribityllumazine synthase
MKTKKILIVSAEYYPEITMTMETDVIDCLKKWKDFSTENSRNDLENVPGIFEIPVIIAKNIKKYDGFIALGCVIKGETPHFDFISQATIDAIMKLSIDYKKPIGNGIITCLNKNQAEVRSKTKGQEAANAVIVVLSK